MGSSIYYLSSKAPEVVLPPLSPCPGSLSRPGQEKHNIEFHLLDFGQCILEGCVCIVCATEGVNGWVRPGVSNPLRPVPFFQLGRHSELAKRLGRQAHCHGKGTAIFLGLLAASSHCPSSIPKESAVSRIPHALLLGPCLFSTANLPKSVLWQPQKHRLRAGQSPSEGETW